MVKFRGVEQTEIADSIEQALSFLKALDIGPECNASIEKASDPQAIARIRTADSQEALAEAIHESDADGTFVMLGAALRHHAIADTDGRGFDILNNISKWGGNSGARAMAEYESDREIGRHTAKLPEQDHEQVSALYKRLANPFDAYGVVFPNAQESNDFKEMQDANAELIKTVRGLLNPRIYTGDLRPGVGIGSIGDRHNPKQLNGIAFTATRDVAQAIADALPENTVINSKDETITPQTKSHVAAQESRRAAGDQQHAR